MDQLIDDCRGRAVDCVVVYRYDRFARSLRQLVNALEEFRALGIDFVSLREGVDTSTSNERLVFGIFASIAEFERELIRDRVRSRLVLAKSRGKRLGRPRVQVDSLKIGTLRKEVRKGALGLRFAIPYEYPRGLRSEPLFPCPKTCLNLHL